MAIRRSRAPEFGACMTFIMWVIVGGLLGWLASIVMKTNDKQGIFLNIVVGVVGAFLGGLLLAPLLHTGTINQGDFSIGSLVEIGRASCRERVAVRRVGGTGREV